MNGCVPGINANILGSVLPIQKGTWNWEIVSSVYHRPVGRPKRMDAARRRRQRQNAFRVVRRRRTEKISGPRDIDIKAICIFGIKLKEAPKSYAPTI